MNVRTGYIGMGRGLPGVRAALLLIIGSGAVANVALAVDPKLADEVESANQLYVDGDYQAALDAYAEAQSDCPECAELAYNQGLTHYRLGDLAKAREEFNEALSTSDTKLEAKAKYNLGNVAYSEALSNQAEPQKAIQSAQSAIDFYRDALELSPNDRDARANIETANRFLKKLQQQQQQQQKQDQQQDQQDKEDQEQDQQEQDQQDQEPKNNDQQSDEQNSDQQQNEQDQQQQDEQSKEGENEQQQDQDQEQQQDDQQEQGGEQDQQQQGDSTDQQGQSQQQRSESQELTEEEAERLLQAVRDKEAKRREQLAERRKAQRVTVDKDW